MPSTISVRSIIKLPTLSGSTVLAGIKGLDREVKSVTVAEIPDIAAWLKGNDFVHSVAWFMNESSGVKADEKMVCDWAMSLIDAGASCLAIKTKRYIKEIPEVLLKIGNDLDFPIIELPPNVTQGEVTECVLRAIIESYEMLAKRSTQAFMDICSSMIGSHRLRNIADKLNEYLGNPIIIEDDNLNFLAASAATTPFESKALKARRSPEIISELSERFSKIICGETELKFECDGEVLNQETFSVQAKEEILGYVSVIGLNSPISDDDRLLLRTCLGAVALHMSQRLMLKIALWRARGDFLDMLLSPEFNEDSSGYMADMIGFDYRKNKTALVISIKGDDIISKGIPHHGFFVNYIIKNVAEYIETVKDGTFVCDYKGSIILFIDGAAETVKDIIFRLMDFLKSKEPDADIVFGIGHRAHGLRGHRESCLEAMDVVKCIRDFGIPEKIMFYKDLGQYSLLLSVLKDTEAAQRFCSSILGTLIERDKAQHSELIETLRVYLNTNCNYAETGREMYLHENSVKYRIKQICDLLPVCLSSLPGRSTVWLALNIYKFYEKDNKK